MEKKIIKKIIDCNKTFLITEHGIIKCVYDNKSKVLDISDLIVNIEHRFNGYGTELINYAIDHAKSLCCEVISLEVINDNEDEDVHWLIDWYKRLGFRIVGHDYKNNKFLMSLFL